MPASERSQDMREDYMHESRPSRISEDQEIDRMWQFYLNKAQRIDKEMTDAWKGDSDGVLIFSGLFSATVAAFIVDNYKSLQPDPSVILLSQMTANMTGLPLQTVLANAGVSTTGPPVRINTLWLLSLCLSVSCALLAILVQQWARHYLRLSQRPQDIPGLQARLHASLSRGILKPHVHIFVSMIPSLLQVAVFLFFVGLVELYFTINDTVAYVGLAFLVVFTVVFLGLTGMPLVSRYTPYHTPLTPTLWWMVSQLSYIVISTARVWRTYVYLLRVFLKGHSLRALFEGQKWLEAWDYSFFSSPLRRFFSSHAVDIERSVMLAPWSDAEYTSLVYTLVGYNLSDADVKQFFRGVAVILRRHATRGEEQQISYVPMARFLLSELVVRKSLTRLCEAPGSESSNGVRICVSLVWEFASCFLKPSYEAVEIFPLPSTQRKRVALMEALTAMRAHPQPAVAVTARCWLALELGDVKPHPALLPLTRVFEFCTGYPADEYRFEETHGAWRRDGFLLNVNGLLADTILLVEDTFEGLVALFIICGVVLRLLHWERYERLGDSQNTPSPVLLAELEKHQYTVRQRLQSSPQVAREKVTEVYRNVALKAQLKVQYEALDELLKQVQEKVAPHSVPTLSLPRPRRVKIAPAFDNLV